MTKNELVQWMKGAELIKSSFNCGHSGNQFEVEIWLLHDRHYAIHRCNGSLSEHVPHPRGAELDYTPIPVWMRTEQMTVHTEKWFDVNDKLVTSFDEFEQQ